MISFVAENFNTPIILNFSPKNAGWGDTIEMRGKYFNKDMNFEIGKINIYDWQSYNTNFNNDSLIKLIVPDNLNINDEHEILLNYKYEGGYNQIYADEKLKINTPKIDSISPKKGDYKTILTIYQYV